MPLPLFATLLPGAVAVGSHFQDLAVGSILTAFAQRQQAATRVHLTCAAQKSGPDQLRRAKATQLFANISLA